MSTLRIRDFSCINHAELAINQINLIVGPQASGKSVICKLAYFSLGLVSDAYISVTDGQSYESFVDETKKKFLRWFPLESWGSKKFEIALWAGHFELRITRTEYKGKLGQRFRIYFSEGFKKHHALLAKEYDMVTARSTSQPAEFPMPYFELRQFERKLRAELLGGDFYQSQMFIPAGRSFFTSVGQAIAVFEQSNTFDPLTILFGRLFRTQLDSVTRGRRPLGQNEALSGISTRLLGGELSGIRGSEHLSTTDGRRVPLALLSSGQQELLPLLTVLPSAFLNETRQVVYIEEPEAHLFPKTQSALVQTLVSLVAASRNRTSLVLTTHSPYVLAKFNNLAKAGMLGRRFRNRVTQIVPAESWVLPGRLNAFAMIEGVLTSIVDEDGLINGDYLDDVSGKIGAEFESLLDVEANVAG